MKELTTYISEKLDINNISLSSKEPFPINGKMKNIINYLIKNGFQEIEIDMSFDTYIEKINSMKTKVYSKNGDVDIRFADTTYNIISEDNPIFVIDLDIKFFYTDVNGWWEHEIDKKNFCKKLKERFDWK